MNERITIPEGTAFNAIGQPVRRKEDQRLLTGKGRFTDDFSLDGQAYAAMVRSPHPHARIKRIDTAAAKAMPGVLGVFTGADCAPTGSVRCRIPPVPSTKFDMKLGPPAGRNLFIGPQRAAARRQDPPCRRSASPWWWRRRARRRWTPPKRWRSNTRNCRSSCIPAMR